MKKTLLLVFGLAIALCSYADNDSIQTALPQPEKKEVNGAGIFFLRLGKIIERMMMVGLDTSYISLPSYNWRLGVINNYNGTISNASMSNIRIDGQLYPGIRTHMSSPPVVGLGFTAGWQSIYFTYSWDLLNKRSRNFNFVFMTKSWGFEFTRHTNANVGSVISADGLDMTYRPTGKMEIETSFLSLYYIFNSKRYSVNAAMRQGYRQTRSAGSFFLQAHYLGTKMTTQDEDIVLALNGMNKMEMHQAAVSAGYGYNYTPNGGKLLFHISAAPMLVVFSRTLMTSDLNIMTNDTTTLSVPLSFIVEPQNKVYFTGTARAAINWDINDFVYITTNAQFYNIRYKTKFEDNNFGISTWEWSASLSVGVRFGVHHDKIDHILNDFDKKRASDPNTKRDILDWVQDILHM